MKNIILIIFFILNIGIIKQVNTSEISTMTWKKRLGNKDVWITVIKNKSIVHTNDDKKDWWEWGNTIDDSYIFSFDNKDNPQLIISFSKTDRYYAKIYKPALDNNQISYTVKEDHINISTNSGNPYLIVSSENGWVNNDEINYDLHINIDGNIDDFGYPNAETDGVIDTNIQITSNEWGDPKTEIREVTYDPAPRNGYIRFVAIENKEQKQILSKNTFMPTFPYIGINETRISEPFFFDTKKMSFNVFNFIDSQNNNAVYYSSISYPPYLNFESPYSFYNHMSESKYPEIVARGAYFHKNDPFNSYQEQENYSSFRYSWKVEDSLEWKYSLNVAGFHSYTNTITIGNRDFFGIPYSSIPTWITSQSWPVVTFVEAEDGYSGSEGIYFYSAQSDKLYSWMAGIDTEEPVFLKEPLLVDNTLLSQDSDISLPLGFRGEFSTSYFHKPEIYMSYIDNKIHLKYAQGGVWNISKDFIIKTADIDNDGYIDAWQKNSKTEPSINLESLYIMDNYALLYNDNILSILKTDNTNKINQPYTIPSDKKTLEDFINNTDNSQPNYNFVDWLTNNDYIFIAQFSGDLQIISKENKEFEFILNNYKSIGNSKYTHKDGDYLVNYDGDFHFYPLSPVILDIDMKI